MKAEERIAQLEAENVALHEQVSQLLMYMAENAVLREQVNQLQAQLAELERRLAKDSHNSSKPPSSDGQARKRYSQRHPSGKKSGGQPGHPGQTLKIVEEPDNIVKHSPKECSYCQQELCGVSGEVIERRQVYDLPPLRLVVSEHQIEQMRCPHCQQVSSGSFPTEVSAPAQYGPGVRALAVYLQQYQLVPSERTCEALCDLCGSEISEGTLL